MKTVNCTCGFELLITPSLKDMDRAVKAHLRTHKDTLDRARARVHLLREILVATSVGLK